LLKVVLHHSVIERAQIDCNPCVALDGTLIARCSGMFTVGHILVAVDFSPRAEAALNCAFQHAERLGSPIEGTLSSGGRRRRDATHQARDNSRNVEEPNQPKEKSS
jgi:hypothetical protein